VEGRNAKMVAVIVVKKKRIGRDRANKGVVVLGEWFLEIIF